jgi:hypothetical protein
MSKKYEIISKIFVPEEIAPAAVRGQCEACILLTAQGNGSRNEPIVFGWRGQRQQFNTIGFHKPKMLTSVVWQNPTEHHGLFIYKRNDQ